MNLKTKEIAILIFSSFLLFACKNNGKKDKKNTVSTNRMQRALPVEGYIVNPEVLTANLQIAGTLIPMEETEIHPEVSGRIVELSIHEGTFVRKGTVLARLFDGDLKAQLRKLQVQLQVAEKTLERQNDLLKIGGISQQDFDLTVLNVNSLKADIAVMQTEIDKTVVKAPFDGRLGFKNVSPGAYVTPQNILTTIRKTDELKLEFSVPEKYVTNVKLGNKIGFTTAGQQGKFFAVIMSTESGIDVSTRTLAVHAVVKNPAQALKSGGFANVDFDLGNDSKAIMIPNEAVIPEARDKKVIVYKSGKAVFNVVETGLRTADKVEITKGLNMGDTIITTGLLAIKPGGNITVSSFQKKED